MIHIPTLSYNTIGPINIQLRNQFLKVEVLRGVVRRRRPAARIYSNNNYQTIIQPLLITYYDIPQL